MKLPTLNVADIELPRDVVKLYDLAYNLYWTWSPRARRLFSAIDPVAWGRYHNPVELLINVEPHEWERLLGSETFMATYASVVRDFEAYMEGGERTWFYRTYQIPAWPCRIAYFSTEYGVHESLPGYSGGLGVLSGDHLKGASDLGAPLIAVGLLYRMGYFNQTIDADGFQQHTYPYHDFTRLPLRPVAGPTGREVLVKVPFPGREVVAKAWLAQVGRVPLVLLDTDIRQNDPSDRPISSILYVRGREMRLAQELMLGVGGVRALDELGVQPEVWHLNEGHSALLQVERMRVAAEGKGLDLGQAVEAVRQSTVFTTHTPVPAGNEAFDRDLMCKYLGPWESALDTSCPQILDLGSADAHAGQHQPFNMTAFAIRTSRSTNGVSKLHGEVSNGMWRQLFEGAGPDDHPVGSVTNGVHVSTWLGMEMLEIFNRHLGSGWQEGGLASWDPEKVGAIPDEEIWTAHLIQKRRLGHFVRRSVRHQFTRHGHGPDDLRQLESWLHEDHFTIGFARRFATYKRADLLFRDMHRLRRLVLDQDRPVQILLAGKAHPADRPGQELIQHIFQVSRDLEFRGRVVFLENYDMMVGRAMVQGVDLWLNTPTRPLEASGTSGQKAGMNGALNLSVLDGWWPEAYDGENGWVIGEGESYGDREQQDREDSLSLYRALENDVIPLYYDRDEEGLPREWIRRMKHSMVTITWNFSAARMVRDYSEKIYNLDNGNG
jgi:starch phosphorylase